MPKLHISTEALGNGGLLFLSIYKESGLTPPVKQRLDKPNQLREVPLVTVYK